jgi:hypothetical protein
MGRQFIRLDAKDQLQSVLECLADLSYLKGEDRPGDAASFHQKCRRHFASLVKDSVRSSAEAEALQRVFVYLESVPSAKLLQAVDQDVQRKLQSISSSGDTTWSLLVNLLMLLNYDNLPDLAEVVDQACDAMGEEDKSSQAAGVMDSLLSLLEQDSTYLRLILLVFDQIAPFIDEATAKELLSVGHYALVLTHAHPCVCRSWSRLKMTRAS